MICKKIIGRKCKGCDLEVRLGNRTLKDFKENVSKIEHLEFIVKTGYCMSCLVEKGYCD